MKLVSLYNYDPSGALGANKVVNESITIVPPGNIKDVSFFCPRAAPFFANSMVIKTGTGIGARTLIEDVDYRIVFDFVSASVHLKRRINVGIALLNPEYAGTLYLTYQALGGEFSLADFSVFEEIIRERYSTVHVAYEQIVNLPPGFATTWHEHKVNDMIGMSEVVTELVGIKNAILAKPGSWSQINKMLEDHLASNNAHTPRQVGLGNVMNYGVATEADLKAGRSDKYLTANLAQQIMKGATIDTSNLVTTTAMNTALNSLKDSITSSMSTNIDNVIKAGNYATKADISGLNTALDFYVAKSDMWSTPTLYNALTIFGTSASSVNLFDIVSSDKTYNTSRVATSRGIIGINKSVSGDLTINVNRRELYENNGVRDWPEGLQITLVNKSGSINLVIKTENDTRYVKPGHAVSLIKLNGLIVTVGGLDTLDAAPTTPISTGPSSTEVQQMIDSSIGKISIPPAGTSETRVNELISSAISRLSIPADPYAGMTDDVRVLRTAQQRAKEAGAEIYTHSNGKRYYKADLLELRYGGPLDERAMRIIMGVGTQQQWHIGIITAFWVDRTKNKLFNGFTGGTTYNGTSSRMYYEGEATVNITSPFVYLANNTISSGTLNVQEWFYNNRKVVHRDLENALVETIQILLPVD